MMQIGNTVGREQRRTGLRAFFENAGIFMPQNLMKAMVVPAVMLLLVIGAGASSMAVVAAAHGTLPGDMLYGAKLASEKISLQFSSAERRTERRVEIAARRLDELVRLSTSVDADKEEKISVAAGLFSDQMAAVRRDLDALEKDDDHDRAVRVALLVEAKADSYQALFNNGFAVGRPTLRLALLNLDQVSVKALEILVEKQSLAAHVLPEAELTSSVGKRIDSFAAHVAAAQDNPTLGTPTPSALLAAKALEAVEQAKELLSKGDFRAAVRKVSESADLVKEAQTASASSTAETENATATAP